MDLSRTIGDSWREIKDIPASSLLWNYVLDRELVFKVLESESLTQKYIVAKRYLPQRTVRYALNRLKEQHILQERFYFQDSSRASWTESRPWGDGRIKLICDLWI